MNILKNIFDYFSRSRKLALSLAIIWTIVIIIGCSMPGRDLPPIHVFDQFDKVVHFTFFFVFFFFWYFGLTSYSNKGFILIFVSAFFGFLIEYYQMYFVLGRSFDVWDGVADTLGALSAFIIISLTQKQFNPSN